MEQELKGQDSPSVYEIQRHWTGLSWETCERLQGYIAEILTKALKGKEAEIEQATKQERERIDNLRDKAIGVIEEITCNDDFGMSDKPECKLLTTIYKIAHIARGHCENPHEDWVKELENIWQALKEGK